MKIGGEAYGPTKTAGFFNGSHQYFQDQFATAKVIEEYTEVF